VGSTGKGGEKKNKTLCQFVGEEEGGSHKQHKEKYFNLSRGEKDAYSQWEKEWGTFNTYHHRHHALGGALGLLRKAGRHHAFFWGKKPIPAKKKGGLSCPTLARKRGKSSGGIREKRGKKNQATVGNYMEVKAGGPEGRY